MLLSHVHAPTCNKLRLRYNLSFLGPISLLLALRRCRLLNSRSLLFDLATRGEALSPILRFLNLNFLLKLLEILRVLIFVRLFLFLSELLPLLTE